MRPRSMTQASANDGIAPSLKSQQTINNHTSNNYNNLTINNLNLNNKNESKRNIPLSSSSTITPQTVPTINASVVVVNSGSDGHIFCKPKSNQNKNNFSVIKVSPTTHSVVNANECFIVKNKLAKSLSKNQIINNQLSETVASTLYTTISSSPSSSSTSSANTTTVSSSLPPSSTNKNPLSNVGTKLKRNSSELNFINDNCISEFSCDNNKIVNSKKEFTSKSDYTLSSRAAANIIVNKLNEFDDSDCEKVPLLKNNRKNVISEVKNSETISSNLVTPVIETRTANNEVVIRRRGGINNCRDQSPSVFKFENRRSLQLPIGGNLSADLVEQASKDLSHVTRRRQQTRSWYATGYETLFEEFENETKGNSDFPNNLAGAKGSFSNGARESASLLDNQTVTQQRRQPTFFSSQQQNLQSEGPHAVSLGGPSQPTRRRVGQFLKSLVNRKSNKENNTPTTNTNTTSNTNTTTTTLAPSLLPSFEFKANKTPSEHSLSNLTSSQNRRIGNSTTSLNLVNQKLWSVVPLLRREGSCTSLNQTSPTSSKAIHQHHHHHHSHTSSSPNHDAVLRKCNTVLALTTQSTSSSLEPIKPLNRLRNNSSFGTCSRCSSLLSLAATSGSKYSLNVSNGVFFAVSDGEQSPKLDDKPLLQTATQQQHTCKLCLGEVKVDKLTKISQCGCSFCTECMKAYVEFEIVEGAYEISCPDAMCPSQGILTLSEIMLLTSNSLIEKHKRYRLNREVELDVNRTWCPKAGCETVCVVAPTTGERAVMILPSPSHLQIPSAVHCPTCEEDFCSGCKKPWHPTMTCEENTRRLAADGQDDSAGIPFDNDLIKCCPMCSVPIEKDEGCAQMMCKRCKHVFCWYCLASLDDDFLLRHYDKGPCKNKLGHSRASVVWHRAQVIGIFAGFGILLLVASPLLLLAAPCIVCCKCRICSGATKLEENDNEFDDVVALQR